MTKILGHNSLSALKIQQSYATFVKNKFKTIKIKYPSKLLRVHIKMIAKPNLF